MEVEVDTGMNRNFAIATEEDLTPVLQILKRNSAL
jgi:hypothetical protein